MAAESTSVQMSPQELEHCQPPNHRSLINSPLFSDVNFMVGKKPLFGHLAVFFGRCQKLYNRAKDSKKKGKGPVVLELPKDTRESVWIELLTYIYTDVVDLNKLSVPEILLLNGAAVENELPRLEWICTNHINTMFTMDNVFEIVVEANRLHQQKIKDLCMRFMVKNYNDVVSNKKGTQILGIELFQEAVTCYQQSTLGQLQEIKLGPCPPSTLISDFRHIYNSASESSNIAELTAFKVKSFLGVHRAILAGQGKALEALCNAPTVKGPPEHIVVPPLKTRGAPELSSEAFTTYLKYIYYGDTRIAPLHACELVAFCFEYNQLELLKLCYNIITHNINNETVLTVLMVAYMGIDDYKEFGSTSKAIRKSALLYLHNHIKDVDLRPLKKMNPQICVDIVLVNQPAALDDWDDNNNNNNASPQLVSSPSASSTDERSLSKGKSSSQLKKDMKSGSSMDLQPSASKDAKEKEKEKDKKKKEETKEKEPEKTKDKAAKKEKKDKKEKKPEEAEEAPASPPTPETPKREKKEKKEKKKVSRESSADIAAAPEKS